MVPPAFSYVILPFYYVLTSTHYAKVDDLLTEKAVVCDGRGERGATETNNLVCTEKQKHIYGNSTHETTNGDYQNSKWL